MILRGLLGRSFGGFVCIRGYAALSDLISVSEANYDYQRDLDATHVQELRDFLDKQENQFFPEIILSYQLDSKQDGVKLTPNESIIEISADKSLPIKIKLFPKRLGVQGQVKTEMTIVSINIPNHMAHGLFKRIDGNHRLSAASQLDDSKKNVSTPFCLLLLDVNENKDKIQTTIFHNINTKGKSLTSEENLRAIFDGEYRDAVNHLHARFSDAELENNFGWEYKLTRQLVQELDKDYLNSLNNLLEQHSRSTALGLVQFLIAQKLINIDEIDSAITRLKTCLTTVNELYKNKSRLLNCHEKGLFYALMYYAFKAGENGKNLLTSFELWALRNHIDEIKHIDATSIVDVFEKVHASELKIFMAMPYYSDEGVDNYNTALTNAVNAIKEKNSNINLMHHPIMRTRSPIHDLIADIMSKIEHCDIFIADITDNNPNVLYEYGVARGLSKHCVLLRKKTAEQAVKSDYANDLRFEFDGDFDLQKKLQSQIECVLQELGLEVHHEAN
jgi:nucleoside 2-deoxyribosyltransferase